MKDVLTDPGLPGIQTALNVDAFQEVLRKAIPEHSDNFEVQDLKIIDIQYKPGDSCKVLYRVKARNRQTNRTTRQLLSVILLRGDQIASPVPQDLLRLYQPDRKRVFEKPVIPLPELRLIAYAFPVDTALPWLIAALDSENMKKQMQQNWEWRDVHILRVNVRPIGYTPQARAAIFIEVLSETNDGKEPEMRRLIGKIHAYKPAALLFSGARALWRSINDRARIAPPVGYISSLRLTLQEQVRGERLTEFAHLGSFIKPVKQTARAIAEVHKLSLPLTSIRTPEKEAAVVQRWKSVLIAICPEQTQRIEKLANQISKELLESVVVQSPVHGDFHPANVIWDNDEITLVDLDDLSYGDPFVDVGRFLASLRVSALRVSSNVSALNKVGEAFLQQYLKNSFVDERRARLFEAGSLLIAACTPFRLQRPRWKESAGLLIEETERVWESVDKRVSGKLIKAETPPGFTPLKWVSDSLYMRAVLDPHISKIYGAELVACRAKIIHDHELSYELYGWRDNNKWETTLRGTIWSRPGAGAVIRRLEKLQSAMAGASNVPDLPRPVVYLRPFSLIIWEPPAGISFIKLLQRTGEFEKVAAAAGRALAMIHGTNVEIKSQYSRDDDLRSLREDVERLSKANHGLFNRVCVLLTEVENRIGSLDWQYSPILNGLHPKDVLAQNGRVAFAKLKKLTRSHPYIDAANFLARLTLIGIRRNQTSEAQKAASSFREAYLNFDPMDVENLAVFETAALLRLICRRAVRYPKESEIEHLLNSAMTRIRKTE